MSDLLLVNASPRGTASESLRIAHALLDAYRDARPTAEIDRLDLFDAPLGPFGPRAAAAKMAVIEGREMEDAEADAWHDVQRVSERLAAADVLLFTVPMWNGGIPWTLKLLIDTVTQPGLAFRFDPASGYTGLLGGRRAVAVYTSRVYRPGVAPAFGVDFHGEYFDYWLRFCGITEVDALRLQPTYATPDLDARRDVVLTQARRLGRDLAATARDRRQAS